MADATLEPRGGSFPFSVGLSRGAPARRWDDVKGRCREERLVSRRLFAVPAGLLASLVIASTAFGFECTNVSKSDPAAGAQMIFGKSGAPIWISQGVLN